MLVSLDAKAGLTQAEGRSALPDNISKDECYSNALLEAKKQAMSKNLLENMSVETTEICFDTEDKTTCELHHQILNNYEKSYLSNTKVTSKTFSGTGLSSECIIKIETEVHKFASKPDPNFALMAKIDGPKRKRNDDPIVVSGDTNVTAQIALLGWYPNSDSDYVTLIIPNEYEDRETYQEVYGKFSMPSKDPKKEYVLDAKFPNQIEKDEVSETLIVLATKKKFKLIEKESTESFYQRLDELGRNNWKIQKLSYWIFREK